MPSPRAPLLDWSLLLAALLVPRMASAAAPENDAEVVVSGERPQPLSLTRAPNLSASSLSAERLQLPGKTTADALREAPGVQLVELGGLGAPATASVRGATAAQTPVYLAGVRLNDEVGGAVNLGQVPLFMIERVEVYRSFNPLTASDVGIGGAIFLEPRLPRRPELRLGGLVGEYGARSGFAAAGIGDGRRGVALAVELASADNDYPFPNGNGTLFFADDDRTARLHNADVGTQNLWLVAHDTLNLARVRLVYNHAEHEQGGPKLAATPSRLARVDFRRDLLALTSTVPLDVLSGELQLTSAGTQGETTLDDPAHELNLQSERTRTPGERLEQRAELHHVTASNLRMSEALAVSEERFRRFEGDAGALEERLAARRSSLVAGGSLEVPLGSRLRSEVVLNWSCYGTVSEGSARCDHQFVSGRAGLSWHGERFEVYVNAGRYQRPPTLSELYGISLLVRGNAELRAEEGMPLEVGARRQWLGRDGRPRFWLDGAAFARFSRDMIVFVRSAQGYLRPFNLNRSRTLGGELALGAAPLPFLNGSFTLSLLDPRDTSPSRASTNDLIQGYSRLTLSGLISLHGHLPALANDASVGLRGWYQTSRYADPAGLEVIPAQASVDLEASATVSKTLLSRFRAANLFDTRRFDVVGFPLPGRTLFLSMEARL
jgi:vitamin B12 transporter